MERLVGGEKIPATVTVGDLTEYVKGINYKFTMDITPRIRDKSIKKQRTLKFTYEAGWQDGESLGKTSDFWITLYVDTHRTLEVFTDHFVNKARRPNRS